MEVEYNNFKTTIKTFLSQIKLVKDKVNKSIKLAK